MTQPLRILFLEDTPEDAELAIATLEEAGYNCKWERVETGVDFLDRLKLQAYDIVFSDYNLPAIDGISAAKLFVDLGLNIPFILVSGTLGEEAAVESLKAGATDFVLKSKLFRLPSVVDRALKETGGRRQAEIERSAVFEIIQGAVTTPNLDEFFKLVHRSISQVIYAENCSVMLVDPATEMEHFAFLVDNRDSQSQSHPRGNGLASYVLRSGKPLRLTEDGEHKLHENGEGGMIGLTSGSWLGVPLRTPERTIGVLAVQHHDDMGAYTDRNLEFLASIGDQVALAIERKRAVDALSESEERYRLLFEKNPLPMWVYDIETLEFLAVNDAAVYHYGYSHDEFLSMTIADIRPGEDIPTLLKSVEKEKLGLHGGQEWRHRKKDGTIIDVEITSHALNFLGREARLVLAKDITETKRAEQALSESEERYRDLVENAIDIIYTHDLEGNYLSVNRAVETITGYTEAESLSLNLTDTVAPEYLEMIREVMGKKLAGEKASAYEIEIIAKDGHRVAVEVNTRLIHENGAPVRVQGIARDITARKHLEDQFRQSQKMEAVGILAGGIAHDFNNLLTAINGYSDLSLRKISTDDPIRRNIMEIREAGNRAAALTSQLLAFSRKQLLSPTVHNLNSVITAIENMLGRIISENIDLRIVLDPELGNIRADPGQIEQVIVNLAVNARDAMPAGGTLSIETKNVELGADYIDTHVTVLSGRYVRIAITDTGEGMDESVQEHIFEPFFTTKPVGKGTGLGLSTVHGILKQSGGNITVYSEVGHGTTFKVYLPCVDETVETTRWNDDHEKDRQGTETILLVEDDEIVRNLVLEILKSSGYQVLVAESGKEALSICTACAEPIHLLLTDVIMPGMSGPAIKAEVVKLLPDIKVLFMSGYTDDSVASTGILESGAAFLEKPFSPDKLTRKIREILAN